MKEFGLMFMAFFAIMNPLSNLPAYMALVADDNDRISHKIATKSLLIAFVVITFFVMTGHLIFNLFGITLSSLRIAGGILVAIIGYHMLNGVHAPSAKGMESQPSDPMEVAISPLAVPLLAGPGTIATAINLSHGDIKKQVMTILAFGLLCLLTYFILREAKRISSALGKSGMSIITKIMGLILTTIGIQMLVTGIQLTFHLS